MEIVIKGLIGLSALAFVLAVVCALTNYFIIGTSPEAFSRAANNLALLAIALAMVGKK